MARRSVLSVLSTTAAILILAAGCADQTPTAVTLDPTTLSAATGGAKAKVVRAGKQYQAGTYSAVITPAGGRIDFGIGEIEFPEGAVSRAVRISATVDGENLAVKFAPHGLEFRQGAEPTLVFDVAGVTATPVDAAIFYVDDAFTILEGVYTLADVNAKSVLGKIGHFSAYTYAAP